MLGKIFYEVHVRDTVKRHRCKLETLGLWIWVSELFSLLEAIFDFKNIMAYTKNI